MIQRFLAVFGAGLALAHSASAACPTSEVIIDDLTCSSTFAGSMDGTGASDLGGSCATADCYTCGTPYAPLSQNGPEDVYSFTCQNTGSVYMDITGMTCDYDIYILDSTCDPDGSSCITGSTKAKTDTDTIAFTCTKGQTYYVVIEGYGYSAVGPGRCSGTETYTLSFDVSASTGCNEDCDNLVDDDLDGDIDCADSDCAGDPVCGCDADGDGYDKASCGGTDCDDTRAAVNPGASETCNGLDDDCDGSIDESGGTTWYRDADGDTYGSSSGPTQVACSQPSGYVASNTDCNDGSAAIKPGATETCNSIDDDCDGAVDEGLTTTYYRDADGDGYGTSSTTTSACSAPSGYVANSTDCNDADATINPGATETCNGKDDDCDGTVDEGVKTTYYRDADGDGQGTSGTTQQGCTPPSGYVASSTDCNDADATIYLGATETCNGKDDDCDGTIDDGVLNTYYQDSDGDSYGRTTSTTTACTPPTGYVATSGDCDDTRNTVYPGATEYCNGRDDDCDGTVDEATASDASTWYRDADGDSYGSSSSGTQVACSAPSGYVASNTDCNDANAAVYPGAPEICNSIDDDCDGTVDDGVKITYYRDLDGDSYGSTSSGTTTACSKPSGYSAVSTDCNDSSTSVNPGASEVCNSVDDDCDGTVDEGVKNTYYRDADGDTYGSTSGGTTTACSAPSGYSAVSTDCDDALSSVHPGATEFCNGRDDDCDGTTDEADASDAATWYRDLDGDAFGNPSVTTKACSKPTGYVADKTDCDDTDATVYPGAPEICDGLDNDCDSSIDEGATGAATWYFDGDSDGYGDKSTSLTQCSRPTGYVNNSLDCNDANAAVNPAASEKCNGIDDDCDGTVDEADATDAATWYRDADGDTYGTSATTTKACTKPSGYVANSTDCDDTSASIKPGGTEVCNGKDDDCDGTIDDGVKTTFYADTDGDSYGDLGKTAADCTAPSGYVSTSTDCDDTNEDVHPGAPELCNSLDDDCDGSVDESATDALTWYRDADSDSYGKLTDTTTACTKPSGYVASSTDCDDTKATVNPGASELCNGVDDNCNGVVDDGATDSKTYYADADGDSYGTSTSTKTACTPPTGYVTDSSDCDDANSAVNPAATEVCNSIDDDCDGTVDENSASDATTWYADADKDGYGDDGATSVACDAPVGYVADATDCDDTRATVFPGADEYCNTLDDDCDGTVDEADALDADSWYRDADGDSYGDASTTAPGCSAPTGYVGDSTDCDDTSAAVHPGATEVPYDGIDQDCDGADLDDVDADGHAWDGVGGDDCDDTDPDTYPGATELADGADQDCDGIVDEETEHYDDDGDGYTELGGDCDDADESVAPSGTEDCDAIDDDCDGVVDDGTSCYDDDGDGYTEDDGDCNDGDPDRSPSATEVSGNGIDDDCDGSVDDGAFDPDGDGYTGDGGDCDPENPDTYPGADEIADGLDNDCDKEIDEGTEAYDDDGDGWTELFGDCDDADATIHEGADEIPENGRDDDCDGEVDEGSRTTDDDGDGFSEEGGDCDDFAEETNPFAEEEENGVDDDCDGEIDEDFQDVDGDGYTIAQGDCDDQDGWSHPGGAEICDTIDNNCNGSIDEDACEEGVVEPVDRKCGCTSGSGLASGIVPWFNLLLFAAALRRRGRGA